MQQTRNDQSSLQQSWTQGQPSNICFFSTSLTTKSSAQYHFSPCCTAALQLPVSAVPWWQICPTSRYLQPSISNWPEQRSCVVFFSMLQSLGVKRLKTMMRQGGKWVILVQSSPQAWTLPLSPKQYCMRSLTSTWSSILLKMPRSWNSSLMTVNFFCYRLLGSVSYSAEFLMPLMYEVLMAPWKSSPSCSPRFSLRKHRLRLSSSHTSKDAGSLFLPILNSLPDFQVMACMSSWGLMEPLNCWSFHSFLKKRANLSRKGSLKAALSRKNSRKGVTALSSCRVALRQSVSFRLLIPITPGVYSLPSMLYLLLKWYSFQRSGCWQCGCRLNLMSLRVCESTQQFQGRQQVLALARLIKRWWLKEMLCQKAGVDIPLPCRYFPQQRQAQMLLFERETQQICSVSKSRRWRLIVARQGHSRLAYYCFMWLWASYNDRIFIIHAYGFAGSQLLVGAQEDKRERRRRKEFQARIRAISWKDINNHFQVFFCFCLFVEAYSDSFFELFRGGCFCPRVQKLPIDLF